MREEVPEHMDMEVPLAQKTRCLVANDDLM